MQMSEKLSNYTTSPTEDRSNWMVWDMYEELPPKPIFTGSMEDCGLVADAKNSVLRRTGRSAAFPRCRE